LVGNDGGGALLKLPTPDRKAERTSERARLMCFSSEEGEVKLRVVGGVGKQKGDGLFSLAQRAFRLAFVSTS
jgi:hypothetical protein